MKWQRKGHEFDEMAEACVRAFREKGEKIYIFGAGYLGNTCKSVIESQGCLAGFVDNDQKKHGTELDGIAVMSFDAYMQLEKKGFLVVAVEKYLQEITAQLVERNFMPGQDYFIWDTFLRITFPILMTYCYNRSYVRLAQISVTERCSLRCKKCAHACNYVGNDAEDMPIEKVYESADAFFSKVDLIWDFVLIGGEPLLYQELPEAAAYIGKKYRNQIIRFCITTNGTILPSEELLTVCRKYDIMFQISNYEKQLPYLAEKYKRFQKLMEEYHVKYAFGDSEMDWMDYGFDYVNRDEDETGLQKVFQKCQTPCREIRGSRYYYCVMARSVSDNMQLGIGMDDFLDLEKLPEDYKKILLEFEFGYSEKGYLDMCRRCNGAEAKKHLIPAAEQMNICR